MGRCSFGWVGIALGGGSFGWVGVAVGGYLGGYLGCCFVGAALWVGCLWVGSHFPQRSCWCFTPNKHPLLAALQPRDRWYPQEGWGQSLSHPPPPGQRPGVRWMVGGSWPSTRYDVDGLGSATRGNKAARPRTPP